MAPGARTPLLLGTLLLPMLQSCVCAAPSRHSPGSPRAGTHSLSYDFNINLNPGESWCKVESQVDHRYFFSYDYDTNKVKTVSALGRLLNGTQVWEEQKRTLRDVRDILKQQLADIKAENYTTKDPLTLQGRMSCQREANGHTSGFWEFSFNGQMSLHFNSESKKWTAVDPEFIQIKNKWENDREMTAFLHMTSMGDCSDWIQKILVQDLLVQKEEMLEPTENQEKKEEGKAPSVTALEIAEPTSMAITPGPWPLLVILMGFILIGT